MTKSLVEVQNVRNCTAMKTLKDLLSFHKELQVEGYRCIKFVPLGFQTQFPLKSKF